MTERPQEWELIDQRLRELQEELRLLTQSVQQILREQQHDRDRAASEREYLLLRMENYFLRAGLPPSSEKDTSGHQSVRF